MFRWNDRLGRYQGRNGRIVSGERVRSWLDTTLDGGASDTDKLFGLFRDGSLSMVDLRNEMRETIKNVHLTAIAAQKGGWSQLTPADYGRAGQRIRGQYGYLEDLLQEIANGTRPINGRLRQTLRLYAQAGRETYHLAQRAEMIKRGFDEERSVLDPQAQHCQECLDEAGKSWQPIGEMIPIGQRICNKNDRCDVEYRNSATGETRR